MKTTLETINNVLSPEAIERMEGLTNFAAANQIEEAAGTIYKDLYDEGFEREEIIAYLFLMVEAADRYAEGC